MMPPDTGQSLSSEPSGPATRQSFLDQRGWWAAVLAGFGVVLFLGGTIGLLSHGDPRLFGPLFAAGLVLPLLPFVLVLRKEPILTQALVYIGASLLICIATFVAVVSQVQTLNATPQIHCSLLSGPTPTPLPEAGVIGGIVGGTPVPTPQPLHALEVGATWPKNMDASGSDFVGVTLDHKVALSVNGNPATPVIATFRIGDKHCSSKTENAGAVQPVVPSPMPVGTPNVPAELAFGPNYDVYANATLDAVKFDTTPNSAEWQSLDQPLDRWGWTLSPKSEGRQVIFLSVGLEWRYRDWIKSTKAPAKRDREIWASDPLYINVQQQRVAWGQMQFMPLVSAAIGGSVTLLLAGLISKFLPSK
jgi:hypothetical protein